MFIINNLKCTFDTLSVHVPIPRRFHENICFVTCLLHGIFTRVIPDEYSHAPKSSILLSKITPSHELLN